MSAVKVSLVWLRLTVAHVRRKASWFLVPSVASLESKWKGFQQDIPLEPSRHGTTD